jgi:hypothetical protein
MTINVAVMDYLYAQGGKSLLTRSSAKSILSQFVSWFDQQDVDLGQLSLPTSDSMLTICGTDRTSHDGSPLSSSTIHTHVIRLKSFLSWCSQEECYDVGLSDRAVKRIELPTVDAKIIGTDNSRAVLTDFEVHTLLVLPFLSSPLYRHPLDSHLHYCKGNSPCVR